MTYAILQISAEAYADIRGRILAVDERIRLGPIYQQEYIRLAEHHRPEHIVFGPIGLEALPKPERPQPPGPRYEKRLGI